MREGSTESIFYAFCLSSEFPRIGGGMKRRRSFTRTRKMDSGFRRNDEQNRIASSGQAPVPVPTNAPYIPNPPSMRSTMPVT